MADHFYRGKTVWVTGASQGIGAALCKELSSQGAKVILSARDSKSLEQIKMGLDRPEEAKVLVMDIGDENQITFATKEVISQFGGVDILINNAGISQRSLAMDTDLAIDRKLMDINYFGTVNLTKKVAASMLKNKKGHVVVISSVTGMIGVPYRSGYAASKHALHGFFDSFRAETEDQGIKTTIICPGYIHTNISINALTGDGTPQNKMDVETSKGMDPSDLAKKILKAVSKDKKESYFGGKEILGIYLKRYTPWIYYKVIKNAKP